MSENEFRRMYENPWGSFVKVKYKDGQPCDHPGCMAHISHPCEGCGRTGARGTVYEGMNMNFREACEECVKQAQDEDRVIYLYKNRIGNYTWGASHQYWDDWLFKAYPGGRRELSVEGTKLVATCEHMVTQGREGETGSWCVKCGEKVLEVEIRACDECIFFTTLLSPPPICKKKMMSIISGMHVTYRVSDGTCFEPKQ